MGEVYRARDVRLKREVAIKILPGAFCLDQDRVSRFQREAEILASLNHNNIAAIQPVRADDAAILPGGPLSGFGRRPPRKSPAAQNPMEKGEG
jgi:serine/threonine protein kinase